ncbi:hypothetical protein E2C01_014476 [Portunus trituberculatus]|uniref:Uncharacterized protein n=1 Tax=Portunus trituberculatus TaxID=210409 RepID=A0A5B7DK53_PORTR|nr:hypothetical protein [Portunus trituberculatus]
MVREALARLRMTKEVEHSHPLHTTTFSVFTPYLAKSSRRNLDGFNDLQKKSLGMSGTPALEEVRI